MFKSLEFVFIYIYIKILYKIVSLKFINMTFKLNKSNVILNDISIKLVNINISKIKYVI